MLYIYCDIIMCYIYIRRYKFRIIQTEYLREQFKIFKLNNPSCKPRYWNFRSNDLFGVLDNFKDRLNCIKVW